jgi:16S rRNA (cytidine1402-2'-O)-methyltransferase
VTTPLPPLASTALPAALYVVATPIGNLEDITLRAAHVLQHATVVACEDTRTSAPLLTRVNARGRRVAVHDHNEDAKADALLDEVDRGGSVALISDAGTPLLNDPGYPVVARAIARGIAVIPVPGPSALLAALVVSGLSPARFHFAGFLPERPTRRQALLSQLAPLEATLVFYAPARDIPLTLAQLLEGLGDRRACVCRELTKLHEESRRGLLSQLIAQQHTLLGEAVVLVDGAPEAAPSTQDVQQRIVAGLADGEKPTHLARRLAKETGLPRQELYDRILTAKTGAAGSD